VKVEMLAIQDTFVLSIFLVFAVHIGLTPAALRFFRTYWVLLALVASLVLSIAVSGTFVRLACHSGEVNSRFGRCPERHMTRAVEELRLAGFVVMAIDAQVHLWWLIPVGANAVVLGWRGVSSCHAERGRIDASAPLRAWAVVCAHAYSYAPV